MYAIGLQAVLYMCVCVYVSYVYSHTTHNDVSFNDGPHIRRWSHNIIIRTIVLQLPYSIQYSNMPYRFVA